jgi:hypothetical protein
MRRQDIPTPKRRSVMETPAPEETPVEDPATDDDIGGDEDAGEAGEDEAPTGP